MGDGNGSLGLAEPMVQKRMWGGARRGAATARRQLHVEARHRCRRRAQLGLTSDLADQDVRKLRKTDMVRNAALPHVEVDPQTFEVRADGKLLMCPPATKVPLARRYMLR